MRRRIVPWATGGVLGGIVVLAACGPQFEPSHKVDSVRIFAASADKPYAKPGDDVTVELLAYDGRAEQPEPLFPVIFMGFLMVAAVLGWWSFGLLPR